jgi:hypothetical protein
MADDILLGYGRVVLEEEFQICFELADVSEPTPQSGNVRHVLFVTHNMPIGNDKIHAANQVPYIQRDGGTDASQTAVLDCLNQDDWNLFRKETIKS